MPRHTPTQKERMRNILDIQKQRLIDKYKSLPLLTIEDDLQNLEVGQYLTKGGGYIYRIEKITPKTIMLSEGRTPEGFIPGKVKFDDWQWTNNKTYRSSSFDMEFRLLPSIKFIKRGFQINDRIKFVRNFQREKDSNQ